MPSVGPGLALLDPAEEAGGVGLVAVEELEPFGVGRVVAFLPLEPLAEGGLDVVELGAVLLGGLLGCLAPAQQLVLGLGQAVGRWGDGAEVGQDQVGRVAFGEPVKAGHGQVAVEVGRRRRRAEHAVRGQQHPDAVAGEQRPLVGLEHRQVVLGVPGGVQQLQAAPAEVDDLAVLGRLDPGRLDRGEPAVDGLHQRAVDPGRAGQQPRRVDQVPGPGRVHDHGGVGEGPDQVADPAGVVEVDVGDHDPGQVGRVEPGPGHPVGDRPGHLGRPRLDQRRPLAGEQEPGGDLRRAPHVGVDPGDPIGQGIEHTQGGSP